MALMTFDIPDGMTAQVIVGTADSFARREPLQIVYEPVQTEPRHRRRSRWVMLTSAGIVLLVGGMFLGGSLRPRNAGNAAFAAMPPPLAPIQIPPDGPPPATAAFPQQAPSAPAAPLPPSLAASGSNPPPAPPSAAPAGQLPPDLAADLKAQPQVEPAPGQAPGQGAAPPPPQNAFGLGN
ncbi:hypothetical protein [Acidisoma silvae]|uniref:Uncharacterized protein n=1 Tax=Acidisoma silvae TaxID=2802396 RepID=A0A963YW50_9PROT|nr:hypothetical protein [Acidisoma silvae]MCB8877452.1 hypothetical protein [Acidisoma silvae]